MKHVPLIIVSLLAVSACEPGKETGKFLYESGKDNVRQTYQKVNEWLNVPVNPPKEPLPVASSYCYRALQDIVCYRQAMPGWEHRLVAYQGTHAAPPPPAVMQLMPKPVKNESMKPTNRVANSKPVFDKLPEAPKEEAITIDGNISTAPNPALEQLPDPALSPQL
jgi:hypothetical protein